MQTIRCSNCGGMVVDGPQKYHHRKKCFKYMEKGVDHCVCLECGYRSPQLSQHIKLHGMDDEKYLVKYPGAELVLRSIVDKQSKKKRLKGGYKPVSEKRGAVQCLICNEWYQPETAIIHREKCMALNPDKYELGKDYVMCPECQKPMLCLGKHLKEIHGWDDDKIAIESGRGLKFGADIIQEKRSLSVDYKLAQERREATHLEKHGYANPFANPDVRKKITETNQRRYGVNHPMQNEEVFSRHMISSNSGPSAQELFFDEHTINSVVFNGYGGRFIRTKTGVNKYGRLIKDLNPDFIILPDNVLESALMASKERRPMDRQKHRTRYVIELLGDWYHSEEVIGVKPEDHEKEIIEAYKSAGIECLVLWEKDVMTRWEIIRPMVDAWIDKAVRDINENPVWTRATKGKVDKRIATFVCPYGSGRKFKTQDKLNKWMVNPLNFWRPGMIEGKDYVRCLICDNVRVGKVVEHLRQSHDGMTKEDYLIKYPGVLLVADRIGDQLKEHSGVRGKYNKRTNYRCPDGSIVGKRDAWVRAWGLENPPSDSVIDLTH